MADSINLDDEILKIAEGAGVNIADVPRVATFFWSPPGHPNAASPFRTAEGWPVAIRIGQPWPLSDNGLVMAIAFDDADEIRVYAFPMRTPNEDEILAPTIYRLSKRSFSCTQTILSFNSWKSAIADEIRDDYDPEDDDEDEDEEEDDEAPAAGDVRPGPAPQGSAPTASGGTGASIPTGGPAASDGG